MIDASKTHKDPTAEERHRERQSLGLRADIEAENTRMAAIKAADDAAILARMAS